MSGVIVILPPSSFTIVASAAPQLLDTQSLAMFCTGTKILCIYVYIYIYIYICFEAFFGVQ